MQDEGTELPEESQTENSDGVDIEAGRDVQVAGDIVGRDKVTVERGGILVGTVERLTHVNIPRAVQISIVIAVLAIVVLAASKRLWLSTRIMPEPILAWEISMA